MTGKISNRHDGWEEGCHIGAGAIRGEGDWLPGRLPAVEGEALE